MKTWPKITATGVGAYSQYTVFYRCFRCMNQQQDHRDVEAPTPEAAVRVAPTITHLCDDGVRGVLIPYEVKELK